MLTKNEIIDYFKLVNSHAKKELGQNFLISEEVGRNIVNCLDIQENDAVLEIGPGLGALTGFILEKDYKSYKVVEYDAKFVEFLSKSFDNKNIEIIKNNILKEKELNFNKVCGNLPYYITSEIILKIALEDKTIEKGVFMVQKECYKRIVAKEGKDYNALNVLLDYLFDPDTDLNQIGMIITDLEMPETSGFEVIKQIKQNNRTAHLPIVVNSSMSGSSNEEMAMSLNANEFISKSNQLEIEACIKKYLA